MNTPTGTPTSRFPKLGFPRLAVLTAVALAALVLPLAAALIACGAADPLPTRDAGQISATELAEAVAANLMDADLVEPEDEGLLLDLRGGLLFVRGVVDSGSRDQVYDALRDAPNVRVVVLTSVPGSADDEGNLELGRMLRGAGMITYLPAQALVASGGTDLFLSGAQRIVERGAMVGVHSWADSDGTFGGELPRDDRAHQTYLEYYREMGIPEDFYWFTLQAAPPEGMHWMTEAELDDYAIYTELR